MATRIQLRRGSADEWTAANPVLAEGESGLETDTGNVKYGDGVRPWAELPYSVAVPGPGEVIVGGEDGPVARDVSEIGGEGSGVNVKTFGAVGDGVTPYEQETAAFQAAADAADGAWVVVPKGTYTLGQINVTTTLRMRLDAGARLVLYPGNHVEPMFNFTGTELVIRGPGTIDGNRANITARPAIISGTLEQGKRIDVEGITLTSFVTGMRITEFGGHLNFSRNRVLDQAQHGGETGQFSAVVMMVNGQEGAKGTVVTDGNWHYFDAPLDHDGSNPGGYFLCTSPNVGGGATPHGNMSTWQANGNYFYGYGQFGGPGTGTNDISPLHTYPTFAGARWTNNYFEQCGFCAMSAKSVIDFVCTGNVIRNGMVSPRNIASEGAISYVPGYQAGSEIRPRGVIANNVIFNPGGQPDRGQAGITVKGTSTSKPTNVVVSANVIETDGVGIMVESVRDAVLSSNLLRCVTGKSDTGLGIGIQLAAVEGRVVISGGSIECANGNGISATTSNQNAQVVISGVELIDTRTSGANILFRDCVSLKVSGVTFRRTTGQGQAMNLAGTIGLFAYDESNTVEAGIFSITWSGIAKVSGQIVAPGTPTGTVTPAHPGVLYRQADGTGAGTLFVSTGTTSADWAVLSGGVPAVTTPSILYGTTSSGTPLTRRAAANERTTGQVPVYGTAGDIVVANTPAGNTSATSKLYVDGLIAGLEARIAALEDGA